MPEPGKLDNRRDRATAELSRLYLLPSRGNQEADRFFDRVIQGLIAAFLVAFTVGLTMSLRQNQQEKQAAQQFYTQYRLQTFPVPAGDQAERWNAVWPVSRERDTEGTLDQPTTVQILHQRSDESLLVRVQRDCAHFTESQACDPTPFLMVMENGRQCLLDLQHELDQRRNFIAARERVEAEAREFSH